MNLKEKDDRPSTIWNQASELEVQGDYIGALGLWCEVLNLKQEQGAAGITGDKLDLQGIEQKIDILASKIRSSS